MARLPFALAAAMACVAAPATAHEYADYFAYGRTELSPAGYRMVRAVAAHARTGQPKRVLIVAHMDTAEAAEFLAELSRRRAQAVATELVMLGMDPAIIVMQGQGASQLARPTPANTPEPRTAG